jgi:hypothetical protein
VLRVPKSSPAQCLILARIQRSADEVQVNQNLMALNPSGLLCSRDTTTDLFQDFAEVCVLKVIQRHVVGDMEMFTQCARHPIPGAGVIESAVHQQERRLAILPPIPKLQLQAMGIVVVGDRLQPTIVEVPRRATLRSSPALPAGAPRRDGEHRYPSSETAHPQRY